MTDYLIADIHGNYDGFKQLLDTVKFNKNKDNLIILGDIVDGGPKSRQCINLALSIPHMTFIIGNHDTWFMDWAKGGPEIPLWTHQGGYATLHSYDYKRENVPQSHIDLLNDAPYYHISNDNSIFVHGGFDPLKPIDNQTKEFVTWDRDLILYAKYNQVPNYKNVYVGHTSTQFYGGDFKPVRFNNLIMCDTGGGWNGMLTLIDLDTPTYYQVNGVKKGL
jgi:serine/threonine protein phosphatase 1